MGNPDALSELTEHERSELLLRYAAVSQVLVRRGAGWSEARAVATVASELHFEPNGRARRVGARSLARWVAAYDATGLAGLIPRWRESGPRGARALDESLVQFLSTQKDADPAASIPELLRRASLVGLVEPDRRVDRTTVWRTLRRRGVRVNRCRLNPELDARRFAFPHRMQMVLCDGKHFRVGPSRLERVALTFLDDSTRKGLGAVVGTSECTELFLRGLFGVLQTSGFMGALYLDRGPGFISEDTVLVLAQLGIPLIHGTARYPEGHGKIEKFNQTAKADVFRHFAGNVTIDARPPALELRLGHYLGEYNDRPHEGIDGDCPAHRFATDPVLLRMPESLDDLASRFIVHESRLVSKANSIPIGPTLYEMPRGYARQRVHLERHVLRDDRIFFWHEGRRIELFPVDLAANARTRRSPPKDASGPTGPSSIKSAAELAFERDFGPVVAADGSFEDPEPSPPPTKRRTS